jgi:hypothetical protein
MDRLENRVWILVHDGDGACLGGFMLPISLPAPEGRRGIVMEAGWRQL